jgi:exonuclease III
VTIVQVNVLNHDLRVNYGPSPDPGYDYVSGNHNKNEKSDVILKSLSSEIKQRVINLKKNNVLKLLKLITKQCAANMMKCNLLNLLMLNTKSLMRPTRRTENQSETPGPKIFKIKISHFLKHLNLLSFFEVGFNQFKVGISTAKMLSLTIYITLLRQNVESNPGMKLDKQDSLAILTYNCNGLGDKKKLKRLTLKLKPIVDKGGIVFLQETHLNDTGYLSTIWKNKFESNCIKSNSAGVLILYSNDYELVEVSKDKEGRHICIAIKNNVNNLILSNSYFPNDHKTGITFAESVYLRILEFQHKYQDYLTIAGGDYNVCLNSNDSLNRLRNNPEIRLSETIVNNNKITNLLDSYRIVHKEGGFTWNRGSCYSRLDYIFISESLTQIIKKAEHEWSFENSDHAAIMITFRNKEFLVKGPGIVKVNTAILDDPLVVKQLEEEIISMMSQTDSTWNPHNKLEFLKVAIRSVFSTKVSEIRKVLSSNITDLEEESNQMEDLKISIIKQVDTYPNKQDILGKINNAISMLKIKLTQLRANLSNKLAFKSKVKWFEYGEKSNKFFLNLIKSRQSQKLINFIKNEDRSYKGKEVISGIREFYESLYAAKSREKMNSHNDKFYENCPKLSKEQSIDLDNEITMTDLTKSLNSCKDSSPGPDGIPYLVYKKFWKIAGPIILESWKFSVKQNRLPPSHYESVITLLPKEGKDNSDIKNWRPITLSNCDAKIITKALSNKISRVLDSIIDPSQTAYVPGRAVADNLRSNLFLKRHCKHYNINSVLISLDAKKAFDSVNHEYIVETLEAYGFGAGFVGIFKLLYQNITARILVNGYLSESLRIERGVKQGDALSCAIFILCIDPLLRNLNKSKIIKGIDIRNNTEIIKFKSAAFADDVSVICKNEKNSIQGVFDEYNRLTTRSGLELNADKTEILRLNNADLETFNFEYNDKMLKIISVAKLKICGIYYCSDLDDEYKMNVIDKINILSYKIRQWTPRQLTMEGKILIVKTFGLSQLIYNMQSYEFKFAELKNVERIIFKFIWSTNENQNGIDRISRAVMKNEYEMGGLNVTDVDCLDKSIKLRQFIRANKLKHPISKIQHLLTGGCTIKQEYSKISEKEAICSSAQKTINIITDHNRLTYNTLSSEEIESDKNLIDEISSINIKNYLTRKGRMFQICILNKLSKNGITSLAELTQAYEHEQEANLVKSMKIILSAFPKKLTEIAENYNENLNNDSEEMKYIQITPSSRMSIETITTKQFQNTLKKALNKVEEVNFIEKLGVSDFVKTDILKFRQLCKNSKLRNIYFRLINRDFFTHSRMFKYNMTNTDKCPRCGLTESINHLIWECSHVRTIWGLYNNFVNSVGNEKDHVKTYDDVYRVGRTPAISLIKIRVIQELIQVERPKNWNENNLESIVNDLINNERYIAIQKFSLKKFLAKWNLTE